MEPEGLLPHPHVPVTCPYPEPTRSSPYPHIHFLKSILILSSHLRLGLPSGLFPSGFPTKILFTPLLSPIRATYPAHLIILDIITRTRVTAYSCTKEWTQSMHYFLPTCFGNPGVPSSGNSYVDINCSSELVQRIKPKCTPVSIKHSNVGPIQKCSLCRHKNSVMMGPQDCRNM